MDPPEPRRYRVLDVLGRGGFGTVYRAEVTGSAGFVKDVALKVLHTNVEANPQHLARLRDEARVLGLVRHRALIGVDALVKLFDRWTVVMEYVDGVGLDDVLHVERSLDVAVALQIVEEVASGLHAAYTTVRDGEPLRLLHRDVKPSNVRITAHGEVKLLDFGVARAEFAEREASTRSVVFGSLPYLAPERLEQHDSHKADVYALGVTLVQLLGGEAPPGPASDRGQHGERLAAETRRLEGMRAPPELVALVARMLAWDADARPDAREIERVSRAIRTTIPDIHLAAWAEAAVPRVQGAKPPEAGEFTGMIATEASTTERRRVVGELFASASTTFDDPETGERPLPPPPPPARPPPPPVRPPPRRPAGRIAALLALIGVSGVLTAGFVVVGVIVVIASVAAGGMGMFGLLVVAALSDTESACLSAVRNVHADLAVEEIKGLKRAAPVFDRAQRACRDGSLGLLGGVDFADEVRERASDGVLTETEVAEVDMALVRLTHPVPRAP